MSGDALVLGGTIGLAMTVIEGGLYWHPKTRHDRWIMTTLTSVGGGALCPATPQLLPVLSA